MAKLVVIKGLENSDLYSGLTTRRGCRRVTLAGGLRNPGSDAYVSLSETEEGEMTADRRQILERRFSRRKFVAAGAATGLGLMLEAPTSALARIASPFASEGAEALSGTVTVLTSSGQRWGLTCEAIVPLFKKKYPNVKINLAEISHADLTAKAQVTMSAHTSAYDLVFIDYGQFPALGALGAMTPLDSYMSTDKAWANDYFADVPTALSKLYRVPDTPSGTLYGLTPDGNAQVQMYRADAFEKAGIKTVPQDWPSVIAAVKEIHNPAGKQYGFATTAQRGFFAGWTFWAVMASYGGKWFDKEAKGGWHPQFNSEAGHRALAVIQELMKYAHPVTLNATDNEINQALADGSALYAPIEWGTATLSDPKFTKFSQVIKYDVTPKGETAGSGHHPLLGGLGMFIPTWAKNKDAAFEFMKWCNSGTKLNRPAATAWVNATGQPARLSALKASAPTHPIFGAFLKSFPTAVPFVPSIPEAFTISTLIGNLTGSVISGEMSIDKALKGMNDGTTKIMKGGGYYKA